MRDSGHWWGLGHVAYVARGEQAGRLLDVDRESADEFSRLMMSRPKDVVEFSVVSGFKRSGFLFLTRETEFAEIRPLLYDPDAFTEAEVSMAWPAISDWARSQPRLLLNNPSVVADLLAGGARRVRPLWSGYALNVLFLCALALWLNSVRWVPDWSRRRARSRRDRRRAKGLCSTCRYDLRGDMSGICPECGSTNRAGT